MLNSLSYRQMGVKFSSVHFALKCPLLSCVDRRLCAQKQDVAAFFAEGIRSVADQAALKQEG